MAMRSPWPLRTTKTRERGVPVLDLCLPIPPVVVREEVWGRALPLGSGGLLGRTARFPSCVCAAATLSVGRRRLHPRVSTDYVLVPPARQACRCRVEVKSRCAERFMRTAPREVVERIYQYFLDEVAGTARQAEVASTTSSDVCPVLVCPLLLSGFDLIE